MTLPVTSRNGAFPYRVPCAFPCRIFNGLHLPLPSGCRLESVRFAGAAVLRPPLLSP